MNSVREYFNLYGRRRAIQLAPGTHYPITLEVEQMPGKDLTMRGLQENVEGLAIEYRGHKEDLVAFGCIPGEVLAQAQYNRFQDDPRGAILHVESKAGPGHRGAVEITYYTQSRLFAATLPGVGEYCTDWITGLKGRPQLRIAGDYTRRISGTGLRGREQPKAAADFLAKLSMSPTAQSRPPIFDRYPELVAALNEAQAKQWPVYPLKNLCGFLSRFGYRFPDMQILWLRPFGNDECTGGEWSLVGLLCTEEAALKAGFVTPEALPQGRKRICVSESPFDDGRGLLVTRRSGGLVEINARVPPNAPVAHPLAFFSAPNVYRKEAPPYLRLVVDNTQLRFGEETLS